MEHAQQLEPILPPPSPCQGHILWPNKRLEKKLQCAPTKPGITHIRTHLSPSPLNRGALLFAFCFLEEEGGGPLDADRNEEEYLGKARNAMCFRRHGVWTRNHATFCGSLRSCTAKISRVRQETRRPAAFSRFREFVDSSPFLFIFRLSVARENKEEINCRCLAVFLLSLFTSFCFSYYNTFINRRNLSNVNLANLTN